MDIQPANQQNASDDQEIAKVLAGVNEQIEKDQGAGTPGLHFEETPSANTPTEPILPPPPPLPTPPTPTSGPSLPQIPSTPEPVGSNTPAPAADNTTPVDPALEGIKKDALTELRPLVDKLNVASDEKFDTYLLLIRSTDDKTLIGPAFEAAKGIEDDARRAQALLDVIKEIDYLSHSQAA